MSTISSSSDPRLPRYQQIADDIAARIANAEWAAGACISSESEFAGAYGVSVGTVRKAIDRLEADGLIDRVQGRGMFVRRADFSTSLFRFFRLASAGGRPINPGSAILDRDRRAAPAAVRDRLQLGAGERVVRIIRLRTDDGRTLLREEIWLSAAIFGPIVDMDPAELMPLLYPAYERHFGRVVARARERLSVTVADDDIASDLGLSAGASVVRIERLAFDHGGRPLEWRVSHGPADSFVYEAEVG